MRKALMIVDRTSKECETAVTVDGDEQNCPYLCESTNVCAASLSQLMIDARRRSSFCSSENYDSCPIFLARTLRAIPASQRLQGDRIG
jgi:hypothetical protein